MISIKKVITKYKGKVIFTSRNHKNGTSRVTEAIKKINASHIVIIQGDEPLIDPKYLEILIKNIKNDNNNNNIHAWNLVSRIKKRSNLINPTFVKCELKTGDMIKELFRIKKQKTQKKNIYKILGLIAFRRGTLKKIKNIKPSRNELKESIEQLRIIEITREIEEIINKILPPIKRMERFISEYEDNEAYKKKKKILFKKLKNDIQPKYNEINKIKHELLLINDKFNLIGIPFQIIIGKKSDGDTFEFCEIGKETKNLSIEEITKIIINKKKN